MSNILISYFSEYGDHTYLSMSEELTRNGNNVLLINWNNIITFDKMWGETKIKEKYNYLFEKINRFSPDAVLNFNFSCPIKIIKNLDCPICIIDADNPKTFWNNKIFKQFSKQKNCFFAGLQSYSKKMLEDYLDRSIDNKHYKYIPIATSLKKFTYNLERKILFLGSNWYGGCANLININDAPFFEAFYNEYKKNFLFNKEEFFKEQKIFRQYSNICQDTLCWHFAGQERLKYLSMLTDLGLEIYGNNFKSTGCGFDMEISTHAIEGLIKDFNVIDKLYNSSKISVNFSHPQAQTSFSWRVMDIMASSSCLLMEDKPDWRELFEKYLSKETLDTVIYKDRYDMREKAIKLLNDEELRLRCVADLNNAIEQNGRWIHRLTSLEQLLNIKLINISNENVQKEIIIINTKKNNENNNKNIISKLKLKNRFKIFFYSLSLALAQIPILDLLQRRKRRDKLRHEINKYWR